MSIEISIPSMKSLIYRILLIFIVTFFLVSCKKEKEETAIPYVYVNFVIYPNTLDFIPDGGWVYATGGYKGIIIYRQMHDEFIAYERACPYDPLEEDAIVVVEESGIIATDENCGSRFLLTDGSPVEGPATVGLKQYRTSYDGYSLIISN